MIRNIKYITLLMAVLCLCGCGEDEGMVEEINWDESIINTDTETNENVEDNQEYPKIVYIDGELYYGTDEICDAVPRKAPDGIIETFVPAEIMPDAPYSANFGSGEQKLEYMFLDDGQLIIHMGEVWYYFEKR